MSGVKIVEDSFGFTKQPGTEVNVPVKRFTFSNSNGVQIQVITYGATITSIVLPDSRGQSADVALGFDDMNGYLSAPNPYFGATVGRVCNRIAAGRFELGGQTYTLAQNIPGNHLHGGFIGFDKFNWDAVLVADGKRLVMSHVNADGFEGYPGTVLASVSFTLSDDDEFLVEFQATASKPTPINLTNHSYFNLAGHESGSAELYKHIVTLNADRITETDAQSIPSGKLRNVSGTQFDLRTPHDLGAALRTLPGIGFDDNYCVTQRSTAQCRSNAALQFVAEVSHRESGRTLTLFSDQPGVQFYTANYMPDPQNDIYPAGKERQDKAPNSSAAIAGKAGAQYRKHGAFCLETQKYPDAVNHSNFPSTIVNPGEIYRHSVVYKFTRDVIDFVPM